MRTPCSSHEDFNKKAPSDLTLILMENISDENNSLFRYVSVLLVHLYHSCDKKKVFLIVQLGMYFAESTLSFIPAVWKQLSVTSSPEPSGEGWRVWSESLALETHWASQLSQESYFNQCQGRVIYGTWYYLWMPLCMYIRSVLTLLVQQHIK